MLPCVYFCRDYTILPINCHLCNATNSQHYSASPASVLWHVASDCSSDSDIEEVKLQGAVKRQNCPYDSIVSQGQHTV